MTQPDEAAIPDGPQKSHGDAMQDLVDAGPAEAHDDPRERSESDSGEG